MSSTPYATCWTPGPLRSRNFAIGESGLSGASSWMHDLRVADGEHRLAYPRLLVDLLVHHVYVELRA